MAEVTALPQEGRWALRRHLLRFSTPLAATVLLVGAIGAGILLSRLPDVVVAPTASPSASPTAPATVVPTPTVSVPRLPSAVPTPTPGPSPSVAPPVAPALAFQEWARFDMRDPAPISGGGTPIGVVRFQDRFVAAGLLVTGLDNGGRAVTWTSSDGASWELNESPPGLGALALSQLLTDGERILALGLGATDGSCCDPVPAAWLSTDGSSWTRLDGTVPSIAAVGPGGFVGAVAQGERGRFLASVDGSSWTRTSDTFDGEVTDMAVDGTGRAVAIGRRAVVSEVDGGATTDLVIWRSADGLTWSDSPVVVHEARPGAVGAGPAGFVIAGQEYAYRWDESVEEIPRMWRFVGTGLDPAAIDLEEGQLVDRIAAVDGTLVATGHEVLEGVANILVWISTDGGATWAVVPDQNAFAGIDNSVRAVTESPDGGLVAVGHRWDFEAGHMVPVAWSSAR
jgi:hypothetical protein